MTLRAKPTIQEVRGSQRVIHCMVYEDTTDPDDGQPVRMHRPDLDFDEVMDATCGADEVQLCIAKRLKTLGPPAAPAPELPLPAAMTVSEAHAFVAAKEAEAEAAQQAQRAAAKEAAQAETPSN